MKMYSARATNWLKYGTRLVATMMLFALAGLHAVALEGINATALQQIESLLGDKSARNAAQQKLDSQLIFATRQFQGQPAVPGITTLRTNVVWDVSGRVEVDLKAVVSPALIADIQQLGGLIVSSFPNFEAIRARIPLGNLEAVAALPAVRFIRAATKPDTDVGAVTSEGDITQTAALGRGSFLVDGAGVKVGVLSDSVDFLTQSQSTGDAPAVTVLPGQGGFGSGEGTAMIEIIHDLAPGAEIFFATAFGGEASFAQNILDLRAAGCDIIVDDVRYATESPIQDGIIAQAVNTVTAGGALYFASAGNSGNKNDGTSGTWEGDFVDGGVAGNPVNGRGGNVHNFGANPYNTSTGLGSGVGLFWADPAGASTNDYDLFLLDAAGTAVVDSSTTTQNGTQDPFEFMGGAATGERIVVVRVSGEGRFLHIDTGRGRLADSTEGFARGHSAASNALATAAVDVSTSFPNPFVGGGQNPVETFSSDGPRRIFFHADGTPITPGNFSSTGGYVRQYPTIAASDGVQTTVPGFNPFFGTSAAAPHAAAVAALVKSYNPDLTAEQITQILTSSALDIEAIGVDRDSGSGIVMAAAALAATPAPAPTPRLVLATNLVAGGNGNGIIDINECNTLFLVLSNLGFADATGVSVSVATTTPGVAFGVRNSPYLDIPIGGSGTNLAAFTISTAPFFVCGTPIKLDVQIKSDQITSRVAFTLNTGVVGSPVRFDNVIPAFIPDENATGTNSLITVSNITSAIYKVNVSLFLVHTWDSDLSIELISPDGTSVLLSQANGGSGDNYGASCSPDLFRTTFDDDSTAPITGGSAPFVGTFRPQAALSAFVGMAGTNVNGTWKLRLVDSVGFDVGTLQCWSLFLYPAICTDGGGTCPGADLSIKLNDAPDPVFLGSNLVYTLTVSNSGPSEAKNVIVNHQLPASVVFASASSSQGNVTHSGGVVVANVGTLPLAGSATIVVNVIPTLTGSFTSTASVTSAEPDPDSANNFASTGTQILPPSADLAVGLHDSPDPALVGGMVAYTVSITNNGPSTASGVTITNVLPISFVVQSAVPAQGMASINGNIVIFNFGTLTNGGRTTGIINALPTATGSFMATAAARANQADPLTANNTATANTVVGPAADLALTLSANPNTVVVSSNWTYTVTVTNNGPSTANGIIVTHNLPAGVNVVNTSTTSGSVVAGGGVATTTISSLASGGGAVIQVVVNSGSTNTYNSSATVTGAEADGNLANNSANVSTLVAAPFLSIEAVSATLTAESITPADGAVSVGETVTAEFRLRNTGNVSNTNLTATLLAVTGVTSPVPATEVNYGVLPAGGLPVGRSFSFTATGTNGGAVVATLQLRDNGSIIGNVTFNFTLPTIFTFANTNNISITDNQTTPWPAGPAAPYPSTISVSGVTGLVGKVTVTLSNLNHTYPDDIDMLLVGPGGQKVVLMSDAGGAFGLFNATVTFDDAAAVIPDASQILTTSYHPANYGAGDPFNSPAPGGPYDTNLASFAGANPNGTWSLFIMDDATGDKGNIATGWSLAFTAITPVNQVADLIVSAGATPDPVLVGASLTTSFTISNAGPNTATGVAFTNMLPAGVSLLAASASQGSVSTNASSVVVNLGSLAAGNAAQVAVVVMPGLGALTNSTTGFVASTASVVISDTDLNPANNTATAQAVVNVPVADLALWQTIPANQVTIGSNITFTVAVTNQGPQTALSTVVTNWLPAGLSFVSTTAATFTNASSQITVSLGDLPVGAGSSFTVTATATAAGNRTNITTAVSPSSDPVAANNTASTAFTVLPLTPSIVASSARITQESGVFNGAVDLAETVTVSLSLQNVGSISTVNLRATLQAAGGVSAPSGPQSYGVLTAGGATVARPFTFTAPNTSGGTVTATLALKDERPGVTNDLGTVAFVFQLPGSTTFSSTVSIVIPEAGPASPYPSTITVSGVPGVVSRVSVTLQGLVHKFPDDVDVLLVGPAGQKVLLLSDAGGGYAVTNRTITIADGNPAVPDTTEIFSGSYQPSNYESEADNFPAVAGGNPAGALSSYTGSAPNGNWSLYVVDDAAGDGGTIVGGWSLTLETISPVNPIADLQVSLSAAPDVGAPNPPFVGSALIYTLSITNLGPATASNVVVSDSLPGNLAYQNSTTTLGTLLNNSGNLTWTVGTLAAGSGATASIRTAASNGGAAVNQATAVGDETDLNPGNSTAQVSTTIRVPTLVTFSELSLTNAQLQFTLTGDAGMSYRILASTNLSTWTVLATNTAAANGTIKFVDPGVPGFGQRFYRAERLIP